MKKSYYGVDLRNGRSKDRSMNVKANALKILKEEFPKTVFVGWVEISKNVCIAWEGLPTEEEVKNLGINEGQEELLRVFLFWKRISKEEMGNILRKSKNTEYKKLHKISFSRRV